jgi:hypothetical protein
MERIPIQFRLSVGGHEILSVLAGRRGVTKVAVLETAIRSEMEREPGGREMKERTLGGLARGPRAGGEE